MYIEKKHPWSRYSSVTPTAVITGHDATEIRSPWYLKFYIKTRSPSDRDVICEEVVPMLNELNQQGTGGPLYQIPWYQATTQLTSTHHDLSIDLSEHAVRLIMTREVERSYLYVSSSFSQAQWFSRGICNQPSARRDSARIHHTPLPGMTF